MGKKSLPGVLTATRPNSHDINATEPYGKEHFIFTYPYTFQNFHQRLCWKADGRQIICKEQSSYMSKQDLHNTLPVTTVLQTKGEHENRAWGLEIQSI